MKKILIVEDQRMPRENMERMIAKADDMNLRAASATPDLRLRAAAAFLLT